MLLLPQDRNYIPNGYHIIMAKQMTEARLVELIKQAAGYEDIKHKKTKLLILELFGTI